MLGYIKKIIGTFMLSLALLASDDRLLAQVFPVVVQNTPIIPLPIGVPTNLNIRSSAGISGAVKTTMATNVKMVADRIETGETAGHSITTQTTNKWYRISMPGTSTTGPDTGYIAAGVFFTNPVCSAPYFKVIVPAIYIRDSIDTIGPGSHITIGSEYALVFQNQYFAILDSGSDITGHIWYKINLPNNCSNTVGWVSSFNVVTLLEVLTSDKVGLPAPANLTHSAITSSGAHLNWDMSYYPYNTTFNIYSSGSSAPLAAITNTLTATGTPTEISVSSLSPGTDHSLVVKASYSSCTSSPSIPDSFSTYGAGGISGSAYQYWFDNNYASAVTNPITGDFATFTFNGTVSTNSLSGGYHTFNFRLRDTSGSWSVVSCSYFYRSALNLTQYQYWFDSDYGSAVTEFISGSPDIFTLNSAVSATSLSTGYHTFTIRTKDNNGKWSAVSSNYFYIGSLISAYKYWINGNHDAAHLVTLSSPVSLLDLNMSVPSSHFPLGHDTLFFEVMDNSGKWSSVLVDTFFATPGCSLPDSGFITGSSSVCTASTTTLSNTTSGGSWLSSNTSVATIGSTGIVTGISSGTATISYTVSNSCGPVSATKTITVNPLPNAGTITGPSSVNTGASITLSNATSGGTWSSSNTVIASVSSEGVLTGLSAGTTTISYTITNSCGTATVTKAVTVNILLTTPITGTLTVCDGATTILSNETAGGVWSSAASGVATIGSGTGVVTGISPGTATISYTLSGLAMTAIATVLPLPDAGTIIGATSVSAGSSVGLSNSIPGGVWSSSNASIATIDAIGNATGIAAGNVYISYTVTNSCGSATVRRLLTVNASLTTPITGTMEICVGGTTTLSNATPGGSWSSGRPYIASVDAASGVVTGIAPGIVIIRYSLAGLSMSVVFTVNPAPAPGVITGPNVVCPSSSITLTASGVAGGTWLNTNTAAASVSSSGQVTGVAPGNTVISYTSVNVCGTATITKAITVNALPAAGTLSGTAVICAGQGTALSVTGGPSGVWSSADPLVATVSAIGVVTGVSGGTAIISNTISNTCGESAATIVVSINPLANAGTISGTASVCAGSTTTLASSGTSGGVWSSGNSLVATVSGGMVTGISAGTALISYSVTNSCGTIHTSASITVNPLANAGTITGTNIICAGTTTTFVTDGTGGGLWVSNTPGAATVNSTGVVTAIASGSGAISYTVTNSCGSVSAFRNFTVNPLPGVPGTISGPANVCESGNVTLSVTGSGGAWASSNNTRATVSSGGVVSGLSSGTLFISYVVANSCGTNAAIFPMTVNPTPAPISGTLTICPGAATILTSTPGGGSWSSPQATVSVNATNGTVTGISAGTAQISYTTAGSCTATTTVTVAPPPGAIGGTLSVCPVATTMLNNTTPDGTWSSSNPARATIDESTGTVTGISPGTVIITYTTTAGCYNIGIVTVNNAPAAITGALAICPGATTDLNSTTPGGVWTSSNTAIATIHAVTGLVKSIAGVGVTDISYTVAGLCPRTVQVTVAIPTPNIGTPLICLGQPSSVAILTNATPGGLWSSSNHIVAPINKITGVIKGKTTGTAVITYSLGAGCISTTVITVNPAMNVVTGPAAICPGSSAIVTNLTPGGTWSSSNTAILSTGPGNLVTGVDAGLATITYALSAGCFSTKNITVYGAMLTIAGADQICKGAMATYVSGPSGGAWSSSNATVATVNATTGIVTAKLAGTTTITYAQGSAGCNVTKTITVTPEVAPITGTANVCPGFSVSLINTDGGGTWSSSNTDKATVNAATGEVTGISTGTSIITYMTTASCYTTTIQSVHVSPSVIAGTAGICLGNTATLSSSPAGGTWSSGNPTAATISTTGVVAGLSTGNAQITYTLANGCRTIQEVTINEVPATITGTTSVCIGNEVALTSAPAGGLWSSSNTVKATVAPGSGAVAGLTQGTANISYTLPNGCVQFTTVMVNQSPAPISGASTVTQGTFTYLTTTPAGGLWSSLASTTASVVAGTGKVTGLLPGSATIVYKLSNGCNASYDIAVVAARAAAGETTVTNSTIRVYPNPTTGSITVESADGGTLSVFTLDGKLINNYTVEKNNTTIALPATLASGIYMCRFIGNDGNNSVFKLVFER